MALRSVFLNVNYFIVLKLGLLQAVLLK